MCRHTVGLNWTSIGIEHVGTSDREILANPRQLHASLRLTAWLRCHYHVAIGRRDRSQREPPLPVPARASPALRSQTHGDWIRRDMVRYRTTLRRYRCA
jgi:hypothetical protein